MTTFKLNEKSAKTTYVDADILGGEDSEDSFSIFKITLAKLKDYLASFFAAKEGISFVAGGLPDMKILTTAQPADGEPLIDDTVDYGDADDDLRLWSISRVGSELSTKATKIFETTQALNTSTVANSGVIADKSSQLLATAITATGVLAASDRVDLYFIGDPVTKNGFIPANGLLSLYGYVSADGYIQIRIVNLTGASVTLNTAGNGATIGVRVLR